MIGPIDGEPDPEPVYPPPGYLPGFGPAPGRGPGPSLPGPRGPPGQAAPTPGPPGPCGYPGPCGGPGGPRPTPTPGPPGPCGYPGPCGQVGPGKRRKRQAGRPNPSGRGGIPSGSAGTPGPRPGNPGPVLPIFPPTLSPISTGPTRPPRPTGPARPTPPPRPTLQPRPGPSGPRVTTGMVRATPRNIELAKTFSRANIHAGGGTNINSALLEGCRILRSQRRTKVKLLLDSHPLWVEPNSLGGFSEWGDPRACSGGDTGTL